MLVAHARTTTDDDHSLATFLIASGQSPKLVAQRLGHANPSITLSVDARVLPGHGQAAADAYAATLDGL